MSIVAVQAALDGCFYDRNVTLFNVFIVLDCYWYQAPIHLSNSPVNSAVLVFVSHHLCLAFHVLLPVLRSILFYSSSGEGGDQAENCEGGGSK